MGTYLGVLAVREHGRLIPKNQRPNSLAAGKRCITIVENGAWAIAADVTDIREYEEFIGAYNRGNWLSFTLYELDEDDVAKCPDEGRLYF